MELSILINTHQGRDVVTTDVTGVFLRTDMYNVVIMMYTCDFVDIMCSINPEYAILGTMEPGVTVVDVLCKKMCTGVHFGVVQCA
jgi:hypothetical protein